MSARRVREKRDKSDSGRRRRTPSLDSAPSRRRPWWALLPSRRQWGSWSLPSRHTTLGLLLAIVSLGYVAFEILRPTPRTRFTRAEQGRLTSLLKSAPEPREKIQLGCPPTDEDACLVAGQLLRVFAGAGWAVLGNRVEPIRLGTPLPGFVLMRRAHQPKAPGVLIHPKDGQPPDVTKIKEALSRLEETRGTEPPDEWATEPGSQGRWFPVTPGVLGIEAALSSVNPPVRRKTNLGSGLPEGVLGLYVGTRPFEVQLRE